MQEKQKNSEVLCGVFGKKGAISNVNTPMINWHGPTGTIFSVDLQPRSNQRMVQRLASGGADSLVQMWELKENSDGISEVEHLAGLKRHDCAVNVVKFHPTDDVIATASDDRCMFIWKLDSSANDGMPDIFSDKTESSSENTRENWTVLKQIRGHGSEVYDIAWSPDAKFILSGTMDNTAYVWNYETCRKVALLQHHKNYVQGVAWDPQNQLIVTQSSDRTVMVYNVKKFEHVCKLVKISRHNNTNTQNENREGNTDDKNKSSSIRLFLESGMVDTFFRRPDVSPDGKLLAFPTGTYELEKKLESEEEPALINVVHIFQHKNLEHPVCSLPTGSSPAIAVRFCPQKFTLRKKNDPQHPPLFSLPYRLILAVITLDNVLLYDTQQTAPFACINSIHYEQLTDASWSSDGKYLAISSVDGFCSIVTFNLEKLGEIYDDGTGPTHSIDELTNLDLFTS